MTDERSIPGYTYGHVGNSPLTVGDLDWLKQTVLFTDDDKRALQMAGDVLTDQTDAILDLWYSFVGNSPHLLYYFGKNEQPDSHYLEAVRLRFGQWIQDTCTKPYDQAWLNYQHELALRHHSTKKNQTDGANAVPIVHFRYMVAFIVPLTLTIKGFLAVKGHNNEQVEAMYGAWFKAITLTTLLWCYPYVHEGEF